MNAIALVRKLLGVSTVTKSRTGFLVALVAIISVVGKEVLLNVQVLSENEDYVCIGIGLLGFLSWIIGQLREAKRVEPSPHRDGTVTRAVEEHPLAFLGSLKYWGLIVILSAGAISCLASWGRYRPPIVVRARPLPVKTVTVTNVVTITNKVRRVSFPLLQLQGGVVNGGRSSALISGRILGLGQEISNAVLVAVDPEHALVAMEGPTNILSLRR